MPTTTTQRKLGWIVLAIAGLVVGVTVLGAGFTAMGVGPMVEGPWHHGSWGATDATPGWLVVVGAAARLLALAAVLGAGYLVYAALIRRNEPTDAAIQALRVAYARGDLSEDEYDRRRERLEADP